MYIEAENSSSCVGSSMCNRRNTPSAHESTIAGAKSCAKRPRLRLKTRLLMWRARVSIPVLLARGDERPAVSLFTAINGGLTILIISLLAWLSEVPLLFPALGPTSFILHSAPLSRAAAPRSVVLGHAIAITTGYAIWRVCSYFAGGAVSLQTRGFWVLCSASLALTVTCYLLVRFSCPHAPACASALIVAVGGVTTLAGVLYMAAAVILVTAQAVTFNRMACVPVPLWSPLDRDPACPRK